MVDRSAPPNIAGLKFNFGSSYCECIFLWGRANSWPRCSSIERIICSAIGQQSVQMLSDEIRQSSLMLARPNTKPMAGLVQLDKAAAASNPNSSVILFFLLLLLFLRLDASGEEFSSLLYSAVFPHIINSLSWIASRQPASELADTNAHAASSKPRFKFAAQTN